MTIAYYTKQMEKSIKKSAENKDECDALDFLNDPESFRSFSDGLTEMIERCGFEGDLDSVPEKTQYLLNALGKINVNISAATVKSWFSGKHRPANVSNSREYMYCICFALSADLETTNWFFKNVYYDRVFNWQDMRQIRN